MWAWQDSVVRKKPVQSMTMSAPIFVPLQVGGIPLGGQADGLAVDDHVAAGGGDVTVETTMHGVVLQHVGQVVGLQQVVDADHFDTGEILGDGAESHATDTTKTIDANFDSHAFAPFG
jgi:hypothetical protein